MLRDESKSIVRNLLSALLLQLCRLWTTFDKNLALNALLEEFSLLTFKPDDSRSLLFNFIVFVFDLAICFLQKLRIIVVLSIDGLLRGF